MHRIKLFKGLESEVEHLEKQVNDWADSEGVKILQISSCIAAQSYNPSAKSGSSLQSNISASSDVLITVLYEKA
ncbi:MAG: hypothetical protein VX961_01780 [Verrucomicrobiota bacterium]|jgi:hypothetical protein|nr:hypothetical protein [Verrucomicrobiota bacterium]MED5453235.1 hypothetical protein [Verrucomicrobiota bacterium]|tara:strand:+ start:57 stop:278 length:222 start_codon:yes stop_codon:yes gene_type:complete